MFKIKLKTALLVLHFCISISFASSDNNQSDYGELISDDLMKLIEDWMNNLSNYQCFNSNDSNIKYEMNKYYKEYLGKIFFRNSNAVLGEQNNVQILKPKKKNDSSKTMQNDLDGKQKNTGYALVTLSYDDGKKEAKYVIDINKNIIDPEIKNPQLPNYVKLQHNEEDITKRQTINYFKTLTFNKIQNVCYKQISNPSKKDKSDSINNRVNGFLYHDEYQILYNLLKFLCNQEDFKAIQNIKIDLFTYMDMCPSCWTVWNKCVEDFQKICGDNVTINVFSMKPYNFTDHDFFISSQR